MTKTVKTFVHIASAIVVLSLALLLKPTGSFVGVYYALAFWTVVGLDFYRTQVQEDGASEVVAMNSSFWHPRFSFADRFVGYLFAAPFIAPARVYQAIASR